jgi:hypothetical protein
MSNDMIERLRDGSEPLSYRRDFEAADLIESQAKRIAELEKEIKRALKRRGSKHPNIVAAFGILEAALKGESK